MKKANNTPRYSLMQRIAIGTCLFVSLVAIIILIVLIVATRQINANDVLLLKEKNQQLKLVEEIGSFNVAYDSEKEMNCATEAYTSEKEESEMNFQDHVIDVQTTKQQNIVIDIEKIEKSVSKWCLSNESNDESVSIWKITDQEGNLLIALKNEDEEILSIFKYEGIDTNCYDEWVLCDNFFNQITVENICDYSFTGYHEVSGNNPINVQTQIFVLINRQNCKNYPDSIRGVVTDIGEYSCSKRVVSRRLKDENYLERKDLEKCFRQTLLVLSGEIVQEVPENVVYAARGPQGSGIWKIIDGTYYCFL